MAAAVLSLPVATLTPAWDHAPAVLAMATSLDRCSALCRFLL
jgi:hypothetical protein